MYVLVCIRFVTYSKYFLKLNLSLKLKFFSSSFPKRPINGPLTNALITVPILSPTNFPNPKNTKEIITEITKLTQSYAILNLLISIPNFAEISLTKSSYASGEIYVWKSNEIEKEQRITPIIKKIILTGIESTEKWSIIIIEPSSKNP